MYIVTTTESGRWGGGGGGIDEKKIDAKGVCSFLYSDPLFKIRSIPLSRSWLGWPRKKYYTPWCKITKGSYLVTFQSSCYFLEPPPLVATADVQFPRGNDRLRSIISFVRAQRWYFYDYGANWSGSSAERWRHHDYQFSGADATPILILNLQSATLLRTY